MTFGMKDVTDADLDIQHALRTSTHPLLMATRTLGFADAEIARLMDVQPSVLAEWNTGRRRMPIVRYLALQFFIGRLTQRFGAAHPPATRFARRAQAQRETADRWLDVARDELLEENRGIYRAEEMEAGAELGAEMIRKLVQS